MGIQRRSELSEGGGAQVRVDIPEALRNTVNEGRMKSSVREKNPVLWSQVILNGKLKVAALDC